ncbi:HU family DNA-binding protein [Lactococcus lactis]|uniref:HU family DNA-binding protein n=1 Tax=Lactococcus lactis TaxID=1358 RepID=UPI0019147278|nr:HU family DNA-binding protein [Lactococcus lactis]WDA67461.1 HU family DNA-binding protein [Lactococcus lactis]WDA67468.1 HU family DNA-binding protein [Lactococcus lactis]
MINKKQLVKEVIEKTGTVTGNHSLTIKQGTDVINALTDSIQEFLSKGESIQLIGFGTFEPRERAAREGRNPQTGETLKIAATTVPAFKAGKTLKDAVAPLNKKSGKKKK